MGQGAYGQSVNLLRYSDGKPILIDDSGRIHVVTSGDFSVGAVQIQDGASALKATVVDNGDGTYSLKTTATLGASVITVGSVTTPINISGDTFVRPSSTQAANTPLPVRLTNGTDYYNALSSSLPLSIGAILAPVGVSGDVNVTATNLDIRALASGSDSVDAVQSGTWDIGTVTTVTAVTGITNPVTVGSITASVGVSGDVSVTATDLDVRDLSSASDSISAVQSGTWDIGTVTAVTGITNAITIGDITAPVGISGDVNIADGGNTITVDGTVSVDINAGSNNIGDVDLASAIPSGDNVIGRVKLEYPTEPFFNEVQDFAAAQGATQLYTASPSGRRILLKGVTFTTDTAGTMFLHDGGKKITPTMRFAANGGAVISDPNGIWLSASGDTVIKVNSNITGNHGVKIWGVLV